MRVILCGYYGKGNGGDEALLLSLLQMLPKSVEPVVLSGQPRETRSLYGVEAYDRFSAFSILTALRSADALILGGGSLLQDSTSFTSLLYYGGLVGLAQRFGLKTIAWAQGIGPLRRDISQWLVTQLLRGCDGISVRDGASARWLSQRQIPCIMAPDPVWALDAIPLDTPITLPQPRLALCLRPHPLLTEPRLQALIAALNQLQDTLNLGILLVPFQPQHDRPLMQRLLQDLKGEVQLLPLEHPQYFKTIFQSVDLTLSMRLHGLIMAAAAGCRCYGLSYDPKVSHLMEDLCLPGWELPHLPLDPQTIYQQLLHELNYGSALSHDQIYSLRDRGFMHQDFLQTTLGGDP